MKRFLIFAMILCLCLSALSCTSDKDKKPEVKVYLTWTAQTLKAGVGVPMQRELNNLGKHHAAVVDPGIDYNVKIQVDSKGQNIPDSDYMVVLVMYYCSSTIACGTVKDVPLIAKFDKCLMDGVKTYVVPLPGGRLRYLHVELDSVEAQPV